MTLHLDSDLLRTFLAVAETGNLTRAGEIVGRTQSAVSLQIKRLEEVVGATLFERGPRGVSLNETAVPLVAQARRIVSLLDEASLSLKGPALDGPVRIGVPEEYSHTILPRALGAFSKRHPQVEVTVRHARSSVNRAAIASGAIDLAVVFEESGTGTAEWLATDPTVWASSILHAPHDIHPLPVTVCETSDWCRAAALRSLDGLGRPYRIAYSADSSSGVLAAAASGLAIAPLTRSHVPASCRVLGPEDGFPVIDASTVGLLRSAGSKGETVSSMAEAIREAFREASLLPEPAGTG
ncbi:MULTISPECIES: LysR substrate-binding domain-containing protein [unclassified Aureimonas]|uniref:LysR substrate-binding domain-containing protein n=1 Tax=unclassified Aureimonas TaxID=2615206 RepID=UPI0006F204E1|nr:MULTISPECIES: LysR substrate-binding domain-containing protein [unclassified Aureimonas]KQT64304.1 LysR family transcriptional regulator [Aureimonas sp. Leaf427]KQT81493.1 LysR family transcriptional regulator [Aureimonas sp. Leaf460]